MDDIDRKFALSKQRRNLAMIELLRAMGKTEEADRLEKKFLEENELIEDDGEELIIQF